MKDSEYYTPQTGISYPDDPFEHIIPPVRTREDIIINKDYPFLDKSFKFNFMRNLMYLGIFIIIFSISPLRFGLKIRGRKILRKNRQLLKNGAMTVSNHVLRWDLLCVLQAIRWRQLYFPAWKENLSGPDHNYIRFAGGIPVPEDIHTIRYFNEAFDELRKKKKWIHVFPESARWDYFVPIRPFKKGMFSMAYKYKIPVIPMAFSYRKPRGIYRLIGKLRNSDYPLITLSIGEPLLPDTSLPRKEAVEKLRKVCHERIIALAGIRQNPYPAEGD